METCRIHIFGASGCGVTTLGRALAQERAIPHHDVDDYYWQPTSPPFRKKRPREERLRLMQDMFLDRPDWVLSGSLDGWGDTLIPRFDRVVFVTAPCDVRLARLKDRETRHFGAEAVAPDGWRYRETEDFIEWASHYEDGDREERSLKRHETWIETLPTPPLRLDGTRPIPALVRAVLEQLDQ